jgi:hypothetical protein
MKTDPDGNLSQTEEQTLWRVTTTYRQDAYSATRADFPLVLFLDLKLVRCYQGC